MLRLLVSHYDDVPGNPILAGLAFVGDDIGEVTQPLTTDEIVAAHEYVSRIDEPENWTLLTARLLKNHSTRHPFWYQQPDHMKWRWEAAAQCLDNFHSVRTSWQSARLTTEFFSMVLPISLTESHIQVLMYACSPEDLKLLSDALSVPISLVSTLTGLLRWAMGSHLGFLNYIKRGGAQKRLPMSVILQTPGHAGRAYDYQNLPEPPSGTLFYASLGGTSGSIPSTSTTVPLGCRPRGESR